MFQRFRNLPEDAVTQDIRGASVYGLDDEKLGTIDDVVFDTDSSDPGYAVVDSGGWLNSRKFLVPVERLQSYSTSDRDFLLPGSRRDDIEALPEFHDDLLSDETRFRSYRERWRDAWNRTTTSTAARNPRIAAVEERFRREPRRVETVNPPVAVPVSSSTDDIAVYGVFHEREKVREAVENLRKEGFSDNDISVIFPDRGESERFAVEHNTKAPEGATTGGVTGAVAGGVLGWLAGVGMIAIPGIGPLLAAGPIVAALAGAGAVGAAGGIVGALIGLGVPELEAKRYSDEIKAGRILVAVHCSDYRYTHSARAVLDKLDAKEVFVSGHERAA